MEMFLLIIKILLCNLMAILSIQEFVMRWLQNEDSTICKSRKLREYFKVPLDKQSPRVIRN